ncbi:OmpH family outer membrane protein [Thiomicrospira microaerophila]|uniref:OmpH family outer membrane protein n=1 Tax=Thiomicrospira microaerophila TaxID=406020 RepID=UPI00200C7136|nr:OmpH family outer membrane protein [Thiomicrospira microaerophila]UQB41375.1 OmpH family outer membrane protein [Thiomicrospira microaerophila]
MKYLNQLAIGLMALLTVNLVMANTAVKVGVVNVGLLLEQSPQARSASGALEREFSPQQKELVDLNNELEQKQSNLRRNALAMSEAQQAAAEREIAMLAREIQRKRNDIQELLNIRRNEELAKLQNQVNLAIQDIGTSQGYDLILYEGIAFTNPRIDLTQPVLDHLTKQFEKQGNNFNR